MLTLPQSYREVPTGEKKKKKNFYQQVAHIIVFFNFYLKLDSIRLKSLSLFKSQKVLLRNRLWAIPSAIVSEERKFQIEQCRMWDWRVGSAV